MTGLVLKPKTDLSLKLSNRVFLQPITAIKDVSRKMKSRRASERRRSSELSDSDTKDLIRLQRTVNVMKASKPTNTAKFFWDELVPQDNNQTKDAP